MDANKGLSRLQRHILTWLRVQTPHPGDREWGIRWRPAGTASDRAAFSRALKRLEVRGLIMRQNIIRGDPVTGRFRTSASDPHGRATHVVLTDRGERVADALAATMMTATT